MSQTHDPTSKENQMSDKIKIDNVTGGHTKDKLKGCYFLPSGPNYDFYDKNNNPLEQGVNNGSSFDFVLDALNWTITNLSISPTEASGDWNNNGNPQDEDSGTFQAQSGGGGDPKEKRKDAAASR
jgi:hypothetical protein